MIFRVVLAVLASGMFFYNLACKEQDNFNRPSYLSAAERFETVVREPSQDWVYENHNNDNQDYDSESNTDAYNPGDVPPAGGGSLDQGGAPYPPLATDDDFLQDHWFGAGPLVAPFAKCGDGIRQPLEECDDKNTDNTDGCNILCGLPFCGNGVTEANEECDDGNNENGDGCTKRCQFERCGNARLDEGEECDDGNNATNDGCDACCRYEASVKKLNALKSPKKPVVEELKANATTKNDQLLSLSQGPAMGGLGTFPIHEDDLALLEPLAPIAAPYPVCGDGIVQPTELCDDGNDINDDGCNVLCRFPICGNGVLELFEECDDNNNNNNDGCSKDCVYEICGNKRVETGEECDDGNNEDGDGCSSCCKFEVDSSRNN